MSRTLPCDYLPSAVFASTTTNGFHMDSHQMWRCNCSSFHCELHREHSVIWKLQSFWMWCYIIWYLPTLHSVTSEKTVIFWDITLCNPLEVNWHFRGTFHLRHQGRRISWTGKHASWQAAIQLTFNGLHSIISQKMVRFITTTVRTSNPVIFMVTAVRMSIYTKRYCEICCLLLPCGSHGY
jgi:hypothetical protein